MFFATSGTALRRGRFLSRFRFSCANIHQRIRRRFSLRSCASSRRLPRTRAALPRGRVPRNPARAVPSRCSRARSSTASPSCSITMRSPSTVVDRAVEAAASIQRQIHVDLHRLADEALEMRRREQRPIESRRRHFQRVASGDRIVDVEQRRNLAAGRSQSSIVTGASRRVDVDAQQAAAVTRAELDADELESQVRDQWRQQRVEFLVCHGRLVPDAIVPDREDQGAVLNKIRLARITKSEKKWARGPFRSPPLSCVPTPARCASCANLDDRAGSPRLLRRKKRPREVAFPSKPW